MGQFSFCEECLNNKNFMRCHKWKTILNWRSKMHSMSSSGSLQCSKESFDGWIFKTCLARAYV